MTNGYITRKIYECVAHTYSVVQGDDGIPKFERNPVTASFYTTKPSKAEAARALRDAGVSDTKFADYDVVREFMAAQDLQTFLEHAIEVTRAANGRVITTE